MYTREVTKLKARLEEVTDLHARAIQENNHEENAQQMEEMRTMMGELTRALVRYIFFNF